MLKKAECVLRPMSWDDATVVREWRNSERIASMMFTEHAISAHEHAAWFKRTLEDDREEHHVFEYCGRPLGVASITEIDRRDRRCSSGYYIGAVDAPKGSGSVMQWLLFDRIFGTLRMRKVTCEVFDFNIPSLRLLQRFHFREERRLATHRMKNGALRDVLVLTLLEDSWFANRDSIASMLFEPTGGAHDRVR